MIFEKLRYLIGPPEVNPVTRKARSIPVLNPLDKYGKVFFFCWFSFMVAFLSWFAFPPLLVITIRDDLGMTQEDVANSNIVALLATLLVRLVAGPLCDRYGPRYVFAGLLLCGAVPTAIVPAVKSPAGLIAIRFFVGILGGTLVPCQVWSTSFFDKNIVGTANALAGGWGTAGGGITYFVMPAVFDSLVRSQGLTPHVAWRVAFVVPFVMITAVAICILLLGEDTPDGPWSNPHLIVEGVSPTVLSGKATTHGVDDGASSPGTGSDKDVEKALTPTSQKEEPRVSDKAGDEVTKTKRFAQIMRMTFSLQSLALVAPYACSFGSELAINSIIASYYYKNFPQLGQTASGQWAAMFGLLNIVFRPAGGMISDIIYRYTDSVWCKKLWLSFLCIMVGVFELAIGLKNPPHESMMFGLVSGLAFFIDSANGANFAVVPHVYPSSTGLLFGIIGASGNLGGILFSILFRYHSEAYHTVFWILGIITIGANLAVAWIPPIPKNNPAF